MPETTQHGARGGSGFAWSVEAYDRWCLSSTLAMPVIVMILEAKNRVAHRELGVPLPSDTEIELAELERQLVEQSRQRALRVRAEAGDPDAVAELVVEAARYELLVERTRETARARREAQALARSLRAAGTGSTAPEGGRGAR